MVNAKFENEEVVYQQSAVIPFRLKNDKIKILLITSLKNGNWIFPKGLIENQLSPQQSALKEAQEEAGIDGQVFDLLLGEYNYNKWGGLCMVKVFPMQVTREYDHWPEANLRSRQWVSLNKAIDLIEKDELKLILKKFKKVIREIKSFKK